MSYTSKFKGSEIDAGIEAANAALPASGGTMSGALLLHANPTQGMQAATKEYVDDKFVEGGGTITGGVDYSTEEVDTGQKWINGKPVYAKTLVSTNTASNGNKTIAIGADNIELAWIDAANSFNKCSNGLVYPVSLVNSSGIKYFIAAVQGSNVVVNCTNTGVTCDYYVRVFYTKTTD